MKYLKIGPTGEIELATDYNEKWSKLLEVIRKARRIDIQSMKELEESWLQRLKKRLASIRILPFHDSRK